MDNKKSILKKYFFKPALKICIVLFLFINIISIFHAYNFTHVVDTSTKPPNPSNMTIGQKIKALFSGVQLPKHASIMPSSTNYKVVYLDIKKEVEAWQLIHPNSKGSVAFFHGYGGNKAQMHSRAMEIFQLGFNILLVDCKGSGNSAGYRTSIGYYESEDVQLAVDYLHQQNEKNIYLFGSSMGAASIMKSIAIHKTKAKGIIIECPFASMLQTTKNRFNNMNIPNFGLAHCLVFWGGTINNFNAFAHNPQDYAKDIHCPTLLIWGKNDERVLPIETESIFKNLAGPKKLATLPNSGHFDYLVNDKAMWQEHIAAFLVQEK